MQYILSLRTYDNENSTEVYKTYKIQHMLIINVGQKYISFRECSMMKDRGLLVARFNWTI